MSKFKDLTGQKFGRLTVLKYLGNDKNYHKVWLCKCICGKEIEVIMSNLCSGHTKSCGCLVKDKNKELHSTHKLSSTNLYKKWNAMKRRCYNKKDKFYENYGGRGIIICDEWLNDFKSFYEWSINNGYKENLTIDRIDNNGNYCPENCRWITHKEQAGNKSNNHLITYNGKTATLTEWSNILGIKVSTLESRFRKYHWSIKKALTTSIKF